MCKTLGDNSHPNNPFVFEHSVPSLQHSLGRLWTSGKWGLAGRRGSPEVGLVTAPLPSDSAPERKGMWPVTSIPAVMPAVIPANMDSSFAF